MLQSFVRCLSVFLVSSFVLACAADPPREPCDLVLRGGRVIDPASGFDGVVDVSIREGRVVALGTPAPSACEGVDVTGLVVAPGFIDLHVHGQDTVSRDYMARDGVTTALELEAGALDVDRLLASSEGKARIHYGVSAGHILARVFVKHGIRELHGNMASIGATGWMTERATKEEIEALVSTLEAELDSGAMGIGMGIAYTPAADQRELRAIFDLAARRDVAVFVHIRAQRNPQDVAPLVEVLELAEASGASLHVVHINSSSAAAIEKSLEMIDAASRRGLDVSTEAYPYTAGSTFLESALFAPGWRKKRGVDYSDLQWVETGERLTPETFAKFRAEGGPVILHFMRPEWIRRAIAHPGVMVASDGMPMQRGAHPRGAGSHARVLSRYVREEGLISLSDAIAKLSLLPAKRLEAVVPAMRNKGRIQVGSDADLTIFDPNRVSDRATFEEALQYSEGIEHVLVGGTFVVRDGELVAEAYPGKPLRGAAPGARSGSD